MQSYKMPERIDTRSAPRVEMELHQVLANKPEVLTIDFTKTEYISSAGLRIVLFDKILGI